MTNSSARPSDFPDYGIPWLLAEMVEEFVTVRYEPISISWADLHVAVLQIGEDPDAPQIELVFAYDGIRLVNVEHWGWIRAERVEQDEWGMIGSVEYDLLEQDDVENLKKSLKEKIEDNNVKLQYPSYAQPEG